MQHNYNLYAYYALFRRGSRIWRWHSDGESEEVDEASDADRDGGIAEVDSMENRAPIRARKLIARLPMSESEEEPEAPSDCEDSKVCQGEKAEQPKKKNRLSEVSQASTDLPNEASPSNKEFEELWLEKQHLQAEIHNLEAEKEHLILEGIEMTRRVQSAENCNEAMAAEHRKMEERSAELQRKNNELNACLEQETTRAEKAIQTSGVDQIADERPEFVEASFNPEIFSNVLRFLPVNEVLEYNVRAVSRLFSDREVWMHHLFNLVDLDSLQPLSDVPTAEVWHPIEEFVAFASLLMRETDSTLSMTARILSATTLPFRAGASEGFQGCFHIFFGPWVQQLGGRHSDYFDLIEKKAMARTRQGRLKEQARQQTGSD